MNKKSKIIIAHIHVWDKKNKGDLAIVLSVKDLFKSKFKNINFVDFPIEFLKDASAKNIEKLNSADFIVIGGGGIFYNYFLPFSEKIIDKINIPIFIFGVGYIQEIGAPKLGKEKLDSLLYLIKKSVFVGVRDNYTQNFLLKNKVNKNKIKLIGDSAVLLKEEKLSKKESNQLGLNLKNIKIGLNLNYSGWLGFGRYKQEILGSYNEVANYFIKKYKAKIYYLKHHPGEDQIIKELNFPIFKVINLSPYKQKFFYSKLDLIVGMMLHSCVMSFGALTPEVNLAYDLRNKSFADFINCPELVVPSNCLKSGLLLKRVKKVYNNRDFYKNKFKEERGKIKISYATFLNEIYKYIQIHK